MNVKVIANYLPQYHRIPENDKWWGEGYTDWVATKNAKPLFEGHNQPRVPLNGNYYDLSDANIIRWQAELAKKYGVYGFGIYHYWFSSNLQLLQRPAELLLANKDIDIHFMFIWDNDSWKRTWSNVQGNDWAPNYEKKENGVNKDIQYLAELRYGDEKEWEKHFEYLLLFFQDDRYIKIDNKPVFGFMQPQNDIDTQKLLVEYWDKLAIGYGFKGIYCMSCDRGVSPKNKMRGQLKIDTLQYRFKYIWDHIGIVANITNRVVSNLVKCSLALYPCYYNYDKLWKRIVKQASVLSPNVFLSGFVSYDDTPRRGIKGTVVEGSTPGKFQKYFTELLKISKVQGKEYVFCPAWNEWGEGMYLEPDTLNGYGYLEALKAAVDEVNGIK